MTPTICCVKHARITLIAHCSQKCVRVTTKRGNVEITCPLILVKACKQFGVTYLMLGLWAHHSGTKYLFQKSYFRILDMNKWLLMQQRKHY